MHAWGLRLRRVLRVLAKTAPAGIAFRLVERLRHSGRDYFPLCSSIPGMHLPPVNASMAALRLATHDSGPGWFATPFLCDPLIHYSTPVYPGALSILLSCTAPR